MNFLLLLIIFCSNQEIIRSTLSALHRSSHIHAQQDNKSPVKQQLFSIPGYRMHSNYSSPSSSVYCPINPSIYPVKSIVVNQIQSIDRATLTVPDQPRLALQARKTRDSTLVFNDPPNSQCYLLKFYSASRFSHVHIEGVKVQFIYDVRNLDEDENQSNGIPAPYLPPIRNTSISCGSIVCHHGGQCLSLSDNKYECQCDSWGQWLGNTCSLPNPCLQMPCNNTGQCYYRHDATYYCVCFPGHSGENCQFSSRPTTTTIAPRAWNPCLSSNPCLNGGTCVHMRKYNQFTCECPNRYSGARCQFSDSLPVSTTSLPPSTCGICEIKSRIDYGDRIVNGQPVNRHTWPWIVSLQNRESHFCGGTLIDSLHVITAAHCFDTSGSSTSAYQVVAGLLNLRQSRLAAVQRFNIDRVFRHEQYSSTKLINDIAIIKLSKPAQITSSVYPICLPSADQSQDPRIGQLVQIAGWGYTSSATKRIAQQLQEATIEILDQNGDSYGGPGCGIWAKRGNPMNQARQICAMSRDTRTDSCQGDSGGPLIRNIDNRWYLFGIVSYGDAICASSNAAGVYTRVSAYIPWIQRKLRL
ncbi:unnamed protein product [Adineta ricciae]|uniref:Uncharacterized protein n=1 Tax=Adineta ricciae TaxID=249248 RepID=A0A813QDY2_ADIRI|nr:unnamed protein product [Adineta ricciae]